VLGSCGAILGAGSDPNPTVQPTPASAIEVTDSEAPEPEPTKTTKPTPKKQEPNTEPAARVSKRMARTPLLTGTAKQLDDLVEDDVFRASVTVLGKIDYDTQIGGNTTVPLLEVNSLKVIG
jgi:hypothetical protein